MSSRAEKRLLTRGVGGGRGTTLGVLGAWLCEAACFPSRMSLCQ